jgi:NitT/TauT family transport system permease protein
MSAIGIGETTVVITVFLFAVFVVIIDNPGGDCPGDRSLLENGSLLRRYTLTTMQQGVALERASRDFGRHPPRVIRAVKGVVIGQLLIAIIGIGELFELYSQHFLMEEFWALVIIVFTFAFAVSEAIAFLERRIEYYASSR